MCVYRCIICCVYHLFVLMVLSRYVFVELPYPPLITSVILSSSTRNAVDVTWTPGYDGNSPILRFTIALRDIVIGKVTVNILLLAVCEIFILTII